MTSAVSGGLAGVGPSPTTLHDVRDLARTQAEDAAFATGLGADPNRLGQDLLSGLGEASEAYRRALSLALEPGFAATRGPAGAASAYSAAWSAHGSGGAVGAAPAPFAPAPTGATSAPAGADGKSPALLQQTEAAADASLTMLLEAHSQIMRRQLGVMSATTTLDAASSGARRSSQNLDTLLRGQ